MFDDSFFFFLSFDFSENNQYSNKYNSKFYVTL